MELAFDRVNELLEVLTERLIINVDFKQVDDGPFHSRINSIVTTPDMRAMRYRHSPGRTFRDRRMIRDGDDSLTLVYPTSGSVIVSQFDRERRLTPGLSALMRHDLIGCIGARENCGFVVLVMPASTLAATRLANRQLFVDRWPDDVPALRLLKAYVATLAGRPDVTQHDVAAAASRHIAELTRLAADEMAGRPAESETAIAGARLNVALACLRSGFRNPDLSVMSVAAAQGISPRYLHRLFEQAGIRFTEVVNEMRLAAAYAALTEQNNKSIALVALESGFSDIAHFNRLFRKRFGATPSAVRTLRLRENG